MILALGLALASMALASCGTTRSGRQWGETATLTPDRAQLRGALANAATDPWTWVPAATAAVLTIDTLDEDLSEWAIEHTPVFGDPEDAEDASSHLRAITYDAWIVSMLATPSGDRADVWAINKVQGFAVETAATWFASEITDIAKESTDRERPNRVDNRSFLSGHASAAFVYSSLAWRNVWEIEMPEALRWTIDGALVTGAVGTAWARVEAGAHFPTDVLAGAALGNFCARFVHDAFLGPIESVRLLAYGDPDTGAWSLGLSMSW